MCIGNFAKVACVLLLLYPSAALGQSQSLSFAEALSLAKLNSPRFAKYRANYLRSSAKALATETRANPELSAEVRPYLSDSSGRTQEFEIGLSQALRVSDFGARKTLADTLAQNATLQRDIDVLGGSHELFLLYAKSWIQQEQLKFLEHYERALAGLLNQSTKSKSAGLLPRSTVLLIRAAHAKLQGEKNGLEADRLQSKALLTQQLATLEAEVELLEPPLAPLSSLSEHTKASPKRAQYELRAKIAAAQTEAAKLDSFPQFTPRLAFERTEDGDSRALIGFSVGLPVFDRNQAAVQRSEADSTLASASMAQVSSGSVQREIELLYRSVQALEAQVAIQKSEVLPLLNQSYESAEMELSSGQTSAVTLWHILTELDSAQEKYTSLWLSYVALRTELAIVSGIPAF